MIGSPPRARIVCVVLQQPVVEVVKVADQGEPDVRARTSERERDRSRDRDCGFV
jgi:hypothetical protein